MKYVLSVEERQLRILGIDPGYAIVGYGILDHNGYDLSVVGYGAITTPANSYMPLRLSDIYDDMNTIISRYKPDAMSIEKLFFTTNQKTGIDVAQARGVIILAAVRGGLSIYEYTPLQVKQSVAGYGKAPKKQVMEMTRTLLSLPSVPKPDDTADALALAICHAHSANAISGMNLTKR